MGVDDAVREVEIPSGPARHPNSDATNSRRASCSQKPRTGRPGSRPGRGRHRVRGVSSSGPTAPEGARAGLWIRTDTVKTRSNPPVPDRGSDIRADEEVLRQWLQGRRCKLAKRLDHLLGEIVAVVANLGLLGKVPGVPAKPQPNSSSSSGAAEPTFFRRDEGRQKGLLAGRTPADRPLADPHDRLVVEACSSPASRGRKPARFRSSFFRSKSRRLRS